ncbi:MAG: 2-polyprenyl-6-methoxyphenol hydroxylase-like oxidoreductase [Mycobacterium sp.]|uniref:FAD-dependent oxidoreductase n=1 Tax=Mycobacterium sp. TaxID=1785 RepID=UPI0026258711|nr:2-polyprenyl-6-methoxyphenol hydroxylase-like oxidoreductase [Mycobacterium sp.]MCW2660189.1 2-polyprenyl-6-methoxyphenol hydroxylase-like oxidoreductase [Mycobacterium sp.]
MIRVASPAPRRNETTDLCNHAVVLGASMGGLLAARVLADFYQSVTVVERDILPSAPLNRRGVPQGRQIHAIQARGTEILEELFPNFLDELRSAGVVSWEDGDFSKLWISVGGHQIIRSGSSPSALSMSISFVSRPLLEWNVRRRVRALSNVTFLEDHDVVGLTATPTGDRVTGARIVDRSTTRPTTLTADLVVDATGRSSRTPNFLDELGYGRPRQDELTVQLTYACQLLRIAPDAVNEHMIALFPTPGRPKMFGLIEYENGTWMFGVGGLAGLEPPALPAEMIKFAADFAPAHALQAIEAAQPLGEVAHHRVPSNRWRRYDRMRRIPDGLLVFGDAICSFNPIYGQGMTVAAIGATVLRDCLRRGERDLPRRFFRASAKKIRVAWQTAVGSDLALPEVAGPRPPSMRITNAYLEWVMTAAETDPTVAAQFLRVIGMIDPPVRLLRPTVLLRIARAHWSRRTDSRHVAPGGTGSADRAGCDRAPTGESAPDDLLAW